MRTKVHGRRAGEGSLTVIDRYPAAMSWTNAYRWPGVNPEVSVRLLESRRSNTDALLPLTFVFGFGKSRNTIQLSASVGHDG